MKLTDSMARSAAALLAEYRERHWYYKHRGELDMSNYFLGLIVGYQRSLDDMFRNSAIVDGYTFEANAAVYRAIPPFTPRDHYPAAIATQIEEESPMA